MNEATTTLTCAGLSDMRKLTNTSAITIIFRNDGRVLMQQSTELSGSPFPGCWSFFGGLADEGESPAKALDRELVKKFGGVPGQLGPELLNWEWHSDWTATSKHFFPVHCEIEIERFALAEGQPMAWFSLEDLVKVPLTPAVYENFFELANFLVEFRVDLVIAIEGALLAFNDLRKKHDRVFYANRNPCILSRQQMFLLKALAHLRDVAVFRVCLHTDDHCDVHEMLMIHTCPTKIGPLKQDKTSLSYHVFEGSLTIKLYDESAAVVEEYYLGYGPLSNRRGTSLRLNASQYRSVYSVSQFTIFLEVASGPFKDSDTLWLNAQT
jgi:8-oxo-dGTP diphosphatase